MTRVHFERASLPKDEKKAYLPFEITAEALLAMDMNEMPWLIDGLLPKKGVVALAGTSDVGKSSFLRQLASEITSGKKDFLGFKINQKYNSCIYISSEDDPEAMAFLLSKQRIRGENDINSDGLRFIFETQDILSRLEAAVRANPVDCVFIDTFTDIYSGEMNATNKIRCFINDYRNLALEYGFLVVFLHHTGKRTQALSPSKDNLLGSQGFEGKMRTVLELRSDIRDSSIRHLCVLKGNYIKSEEKSSSYVLKFEDNMTFTNTGERMGFSLLTKPDGNYEEREKTMAQILNLKSQGLSFREIEKALKEKGFKVSKSKIATMVKDCPTVQAPLEEKDTGQQDEEEGLVAA